MMPHSKVLTGSRSTWLDEAVISGLVRGSRMAGLLFIASGQEPISINYKSVLQKYRDVD